MSTPLRSQDVHRPPPIDLDRSAEAAGRLGSAPVAPPPALAPSDRAEALHAEHLAQRANDLVSRDPVAFRDAAALAFGDKADPLALGTLVELAHANRLPAPPVRFVEPGALGAGASGASGAYAAAGGPGGEGLILLDRSLLADPAELEAVYVEEFGHHLDRLLGGADAAGDEGAIFAQALLDPGAAPSGSALVALRVENDHARLLIDGRTVAVEFDYHDEAQGGDTSGGDVGGRADGPGTDGISGGDGGGGGASPSGDTTEDNNDRPAPAGGGGAQGADESDEADEADEDEGEEGYKAPETTPGGFDPSLGGLIDGGAPGAPGGEREEYVTVDVGGGTGGAGLNDDVGEDNAGEGGLGAGGGGAGGGPVGGDEDEGGERTEYVTLGGGAPPIPGVSGSGAEPAGDVGGEQDEGEVVSGPLGPVFDPPPDNLDGNPVDGVFAEAGIGNELVTPPFRPGYGGGGIAPPGTAAAPPGAGTGAEVERPGGLLDGLKDLVRRGGSRLGGVVTLMLAPRPTGGDLETVSVSGTYADVEVQSYGSSFDGEVYINGERAGITVREVFDENGRPSGSYAPTNEADRATLESYGVSMDYGTNAFETSGTVPEEGVDEPAEDDGYEPLDLGPRGPELEPAPVPASTTSTPIPTPTPAVAPSGNGGPAVDAPTMTSEAVAGGAPMPTTPAPAAGPMPMQAHPEEAPGPLVTPAAPPMPGVPPTSATVVDGGSDGSTGSEPDEVAAELGGPSSTELPATPPDPDDLIIRSDSDRIIPVPGALTGRKSEIPADANDEHRRGLNRENEAGPILVANGYGVHRNPPRLPNGKEPDYMITGPAGQGTIGEGLVADAYSPRTSDAFGIVGKTAAKINVGQAEAVVLNLADSDVDIDELLQEFRANPVEGPVIIITSSEDLIVVEQG